MNLSMCLETVQGKVRSTQRCKTDWGGGVNPFKHQNNIHSNIYPMPCWEGMTAVLGSGTGTVNQTKTQPVL